MRLLPGIPAVVLLLSSLAFAAPAVADDQRDFLSAYAGVNFEERAFEFLREMSPTFQDSYIYALAGTWSWARTRRARWELEGQIVRHSGLQQHWEINLVPAVRWMHTPWDHVLDTRFAIGWGLSWASQEPPIEPRQEEEVGEGDSARLLSYTLLEVEFMPPSSADWSGFVRLHHRSGVGGAFGGVRGGSNFLGAGIRRYF
ncbi:MAG: hypothetical protein EA347_12020 [Thioalkalivibrio sp.]|nr:MAG: hypothetical protein EA347_12020 [Thioalkalivibrio sp.]